MKITNLWSRVILKILYVNKEQETERKKKERSIGNKHKIAKVKQDVKCRFSCGLSFN